MSGRLFEQVNVDGSDKAEAVGLRWLIYWDLLRGAWAEVRTATGAIELRDAWILVTGAACYPTGGLACSDFAKSTSTRRLSDGILGQASANSSPARSAAMARKGFTGPPSDGSASTHSHLGGPHDRTLFLGNGRGHDLGGRMALQK
jgi:hypothetical protein